MAQSGAHRIAPKLLLAALTTLITLLLVEVGARLWALKENRETLSAAMSTEREPSADIGAGMINIIRLSEDDRIIYELIPNLVRRPYHGNLIDTNRWGFRSPDHPLEAAPGTLTIVGLGDSILFGHGVKNDETYFTLLQDTLERELPDHPWRVINTGVPGYNTVMEVRTLRERALRFKPDLVLLNLVDNDLAPPKFMRDEEDVWDLQRSFLAELVRRATQGSATAEKDNTSGLMSGGEWWERDSDGRNTVPERYREVFGRPAFEHALDELLELSYEHDFQVVCFASYTFGNIPYMIGEAKERGIPVIELQPDLATWLRENTGQALNEKTYRASRLCISKRNSHPSPLTHRLAARRLFEDLRSLGAL